MHDPKTLFQINAYILARKEAAKIFQKKLYEKTGLDLEQDFIEELIEYVAFAAIEGRRIKNQIFTINVIKPGGNGEPEEPGQDDDDETKH